MQGQGLLEPGAIAFPGPHAHSLLEGRRTSGFVDLPIKRVVGAAAVAAREVGSQGESVIRRHGHAGEIEQAVSLCDVAIALGLGRAYEAKRQSLERRL